MAKRQREWARKETDRLKALLGGKCFKCGSTKNLEFDVIHPQGDGHQKREWSWRISFYRKQLYANNLQLLCEGCNKSKRDNLVLCDYKQVEQPF